MIPGNGNEPPTRNNGNGGMMVVLPQDALGSSSAAAAGAGGGPTGVGVVQQDQRPVVREQDRFMPIANVIRIMRKVLPTHAKISDDAKETIQECVSEYISFITSEANERCQQEQRKTITAEDVLWAMSKLGFDDYIEPLSMYIQRYREIEGDHRGSIRGDHLPPIKRSGSSDISGHLFGPQPPPGLMYGPPPTHHIPYHHQSMFGGGGSGGGGGLMGGGLMGGGGGLMGNGGGGGYYRGDLSGIGGASGGGGVGPPQQAPPQMSGLQPNQHHNLGPNYDPFAGGPFK